MNINISYSELTDLLNQAAERAARKAVIDAGLVPKIITKSEVVDLYGLKVFLHSQNYVTWKKNGNSTSKWFCERDEFDRYLLRQNIDFK